jgi:hypothetical protein
MLSEIDVYADIVATVALALAIGGFGYTAWSRKHEPEHQAAITTAIKKSEAFLALLPQLRDDVILALSFLDADDPPAIEVLPGKEANRLEPLRKTWVNKADQGSPTINHPSSLR